MYAEWSEHDTVERFLKPIYMEHFAKAFIEARITGQVLVALEEKHLQELGVNVVGDRIMMLDYLKVLMCTRAHTHTHKHAHTHTQTRRY